MPNLTVAFHMRFPWPRRGAFLIRRGLKCDSGFLAHGLMGFKPMRFIIFMAAFLFDSSANAEGLNYCQIREAYRCIQEQSGEPDSSRGGQKVAEYCADVALQKCS